MKKILSIVALTLIAILASSIIVFSCVDKDYNPNLENPDYIKIFVDSSSSEAYFNDNTNEENQKVYNETLRLYNESFKQKMMSAIFNGTLFENPTISKLSPKKNSFSTGIYINFHYNEKQILKLNNDVYTYKTEKTTETNIEYNDLYIEVKDSENLTTFNIYVQKLNSSYYYYHYTVRAKQADLYNYLKGIN